MVFMNFSLIKKSNKIPEGPYNNFKQMKDRIEFKMSFLSYSGRCIINCSVSAGKLETHTQMSQSWGGGC